MTDIVDEVIAEEIQTSAEEVAISPTEERARQAGWRPKEEFNGDEEKWVDAGEYLRRGELFDRIHSQKREIDDVRKALNDMREHQNKIRESAYKQALQDVKRQQAQAVETGDSEAFMKAEQQAEALKQAWEEEKAPKKGEEAKNSSKVFDAFVLMNPWYLDDSKKRDYADQIGFDYARANGIDLPTASEAEQRRVLAHVAKRVEAEFDKPKPQSKVEGANSKPSQEKSSPLDKVEASLTADERKAMQRFVRLGVMTKEEYLKEYAQQ